MRGPSGERPSRPQSPGVSPGDDRGSVQSRAVLIGLVVLLLAIWVLKSSLHLAGGALRIILLVVIVAAVATWITRSAQRR